MNILLDYRIIIKYYVETIVKDKAKRYIELYYRDGNRTWVFWSVLQSHFQTRWEYLCHKKDIYKYYQSTWNFYLG